MAAIILRSVLTGVHELIAATKVIVPVLLVAYFVMRLPANDLVVAIGVPTLIVIALLRILTVTRFRPLVPKQAEPPAERRHLEIPKWRLVFYGYLLGTTFFSLVWSVAFLLSIPAYIALGIAIWVAIKGFGCGLLLFLITLGLLVLVGIVESGSMRAVVRKISFSISSVSPGPFKGVISSFGDYISHMHP